MTTSSPLALAYVEKAHGLKRDLHNYTEFFRQQMMDVVKNTVVAVYKESFGTNKQIMVLSQFLQETTATSSKHPCKDRFCMPIESVRVAAITDLLANLMLLDGESGGESCVLIMQQDDVDCYVLLKSSVGANDDGAVVEYQIFYDDYNTARLPISAQNLILVLQEILRIVQEHSVSVADEDSAAHDDYPKNQVDYHMRHYYFVNH